MVHLINQSSGDFFAFIRSLTSTERSCPERLSNEKVYSDKEVSKFKLRMQFTLTDTRRKFYNLHGYTNLEQKIKSSPNSFASIIQVDWRNKNIQKFSIALLIKIFLCLGIYIYMLCTQNIISCTLIAGYKTYKKRGQKFPHVTTLYSTLSM